MKFTIVEYIGPNTVIGKTSKGLVRGRIAVNLPHPEAGSEITLKDAAVTEYEAPKAEKAKAPKAAKDGPVKVPDSAPPK